MKKMTLKQARAAYVQAMVESIVTKQFVRDVAKSANEQMEDEACMCVLYGDAKRVDKATARCVIVDAACGSTDDFNYEDDLYAVRDEIGERVERALRKALKVDGTRIVKVARHARGSTEVIK
jgi:hypothetical protein